MASRVVPGTSETTNRSSPRSAFTKVLLPTLGRPTTASRMSPVGRSSSETSSGSGSSSGGLGASGTSRRVEDRLDQVGDAAGVLRGDRHHVPEPEGVELRDGGLSLRHRRVDLVHRHEERLPGAAEEVCDGAVDARRPLAPVHHEDDGGRLVHGELRLVPDLGQ